MNIHTLRIGREGNKFILRRRLFQNPHRVGAQLAKRSKRLHAVHSVPLLLNRTCAPVFVYIETTYQSKLLMSRQACLAFPPTNEMSA